jgi:hypothetical protein
MWKEILLHWDLAIIYVLICILGALSFIGIIDHIKEEMRNHK